LRYPDLDGHLNGVETSWMQPTDSEQTPSGHCLRSRPAHVRAVESEYFTAKRKAAKRLCRGHVKPSDLPSNAEIRDLIQVFARTHEGEQRTANLRDMRLPPCG
jgi:hypothetical protein